MCYYKEGRYYFRSLNYNVITKFSNISYLRVESFHVIALEAELTMSVLAKVFGFYSLVSTDIFTRPSSPSRPVHTETISIPRGILHSS